MLAWETEQHIKRLILEYERRIERLRAHAHKEPNYGSLLVMNANINAYQEFIKNLETLLD